MLSFHPKDNTERENYKLLIGTVIPRPIAFVTTKSESGIINAAPFSYFNIAATDPPMLSVAFQRKNGELKDSSRNILSTKEFVIHLIDTELAEEVNKTAASLAPEESELSLTNFDLIESSVIGVPGIQQAKARFECRLEKAIELGTADRTTSDLLIGRIEQFHIAEEIYEAGKINPEKLGAISRLAGHDYAEIGKVFTIERPK
jgi:flavin reductase (DIM6/NTAB) family NADH-FMN oxidoreductase RutF